MPRKWSSSARKAVTHSTTDHLCWDGQLRVPPDSLWQFRQVVKHREFQGFLLQKTVRKPGADLKIKCLADNPQYLTSVLSKLDVSAMLVYWRVMDPNLAPLPLSWLTAYSEIHPSEADFCNLTLFLDVFTKANRRIPVPSGRKPWSSAKVQPLWDGIILQRASLRCNIAPWYLSTKSLNLNTLSSSASTLVFQETTLQHWHLQSAERFMTEEMACILITVPHKEALCSLHQWL